MSADVGERLSNDVITAVAITEPLPSRRRRRYLPGSSSASVNP
jgi:hypothetical protein